MGSRPHDLASHRGRRRLLIERLRELGIRDLAVLHAFDAVPRHLFVPEAFQARAYADEALPIGAGQTMSRPSTHALYLQTLALRGEERVLEVGTGSGFQTALLATLCRQVFSIERVPELALAARARIEALGFTNVAIRSGDGRYGWRKYSPFDAILVSAATQEVPAPLLEQLRVGGRLLIPIGGTGGQQLHRVERTGERTVKDEIVGEVRFVPISGSGELKAGPGRGEGRGRDADE